MSMAGGGASAPQMNVTPLIDVLLVLIIIFMVIVTETKEKGLDAQIPQPPANPDSVPSPVRTIVISWRGEEWGCARPQDQPAEREVGRVEDAAQGHLQGACGEGRVRRGRRQVNFEYVAYVIDTARAAAWSGWGSCQRRWRRGSGRSSIVPG